jgi:hypothetical protein
MCSEQSSDVPQARFPRSGRAHRRATQYGQRTPSRNPPAELRRLPRRSRADQPRNVRPDAPSTCRSAGSNLVFDRIRTSGKQAAARPAVPSALGDWVRFRVDPDCGRHRVLAHFTSSGPAVAGRLAQRQWCPPGRTGPMAGNRFAFPRESRSRHNRLGGCGAQHPRARSNNAS